MRQFIQSVIILVLDVFMSLSLWLCVCRHFSVNLSHYFLSSNGTKVSSAEMFYHIHHIKHNNNDQCSTTKMSSLSLDNHVSQRSAVSRKQLIKPTVHIRWWRGEPFATFLWCNLVLAAVNSHFLVLFTLKHDALLLFQLLARSSLAKAAIQVSPKSHGKVASLRWRFREGT